MEQINYEILYLGKNTNAWQVKDYIVTENNGKWLCSCAIKFKRNPELKCKHQDIVQHMLLTDEQREELYNKQDRYLIKKQLRELLKDNCNHLFTAVKTSNTSWGWKCAICHKQIDTLLFKAWRNKKYEKNN